MENNSTFLYGKLIAAAAIATGATFVYLSSSDTTDLSESPIQTASKANTKASPRPWTDASEKLETQQQIAQLKAEIARLKSDLAVLRNRFDKEKSDAGTKTSSIEYQPQQAPTEAEMAQEAENAQKRTAQAEEQLSGYLENIESNFRAEPKNATWADPIAERINRLWANTQPSDVHLTALDCRTTMCRIEIQTGSEPADVYSTLFAELSPDLPGVMQIPAADPADATSIYYLARDQFPSPP